LSHAQESVRNSIETLEVFFLDIDRGIKVASFGLSLRSRWYCLLKYPETMVEKFDYLIDGSIAYTYQKGLKANPWMSSLVLRERLDAVPQFINYLVGKNILTPGMKICSLVLADSSSAKSEDRKKKGINDTGEWTIKMMERFNRENKENGYRRVGRTELFVRTFQV
jgi:hypothetical protein